MFQESFPHLLDQRLQYYKIPRGRVQAGLRLTSSKGRRRLENSFLCRRRETLRGRGDWLHTPDPSPWGKVLGGQGCSVVGEGSKGGRLDQVWDEICLLETVLIRVGFFFFFLFALGCVCVCRKLWDTGQLLAPLEGLNSVLRLVQQESLFVKLLAGPRSLDFILRALGQLVSLKGPKLGAWE